MASLSNHVNGWGAALLVLCTAACAGAPRELRIPPPLDDPSLGAGDMLAIRVAGEPELSGDFRIESDAAFQYPYLGRLRVAGLDASGVADILRERLAARRLILAAQVEVSVRNADSRNLAVVGQVVRPGAFPSEPRTTVVRAIAAAGGFTDLADHTVLLTRRTRGGAEHYAIAVDAILAGRIADVTLGPRDVITVRERPGALPFWQR